MRRSPWTLLLVLGSCFQNQSCPSSAGGTCEPSNANCPAGYRCATVAQVCTRSCETTTDCWVKVTDGCRPDQLPGQVLPDGGVFTEDSSDGYCPETKRLVCLSGYCQLQTCLDGGCDYDPYGPSPFAGNRSQGPQE